jgi:tetratricopeptide (TPR) repeat protein
MIFCYMAEINLGMAGRSSNTKRIEDGVAYLGSKSDTGRYHVGSLQYSIGNGFSALRREEEAARAYEKAFEYLANTDDAQLLAQCYMNLGSTHQRLGNGEIAPQFFYAALQYRPQLSEAHHALGLHFLRSGEYGQALEHFDQVVFAEYTLGKRSSVSGWRINALFNLADGKAAFREINTLLSDAAGEAWIWPWCAQQVALFGRTSLENAKLSIPFWDLYLKAHPNCPSGLRERLLNKLYLRAGGQGIGSTYLAFKDEFETSIQHVEGEAVAYLWDRLGHWAEEEDNWEEAEHCFRAAYALEGGLYGYCLGTALNFLDRAEESLPLLLAQAEVIQPDDCSWFQVAVAYEKLGRNDESINAYQKVITLNPNNSLAWFNMGGLHWNAGEWEEARRIWKTAVVRFPDHDLAARLRRDLPFVLR